MTLDPSVYKTENPVPSDASKDLSDNARVLDTYVNDTSGDDIYDRLGNRRLTLEGVKNATLEAVAPVYLPTVTATDGQTRFFLGVGKQNVQVNINGSIQQTETFTYDDVTGYVTLTSPLGGGENVQLAYSVTFGSEVPAPSPVLTADRFKNVYDMQANASDELEVGTLVSSGLSVWQITETVTVIPLDSGKYAQAHGDLWANDFRNPDETDDGIGLRLMRDHAEELERSITLRSSGGVYALESTETVPEYGGEVGLYLTKLNLVKVDFGWGLVAFRVSTPGLGAIDKQAVLALAPPSGANSYYAYADIKNIRLSGGNWTDINERPFNVVKANYRKLAYCMFENIEMQYSLDDVWISDGFVILMEKVRARNAGPVGRGFYLDVASGANTGYLLSGCTVTTAGVGGFRISGDSGHTYCHLNNCHADFVGRDDAGETIDSSTPFAYAYDISASECIVLTACGAEFCTKLLRADTARTLKVNGLYSLGAGDSDGVTDVDHLIKISGYSENVDINTFTNKNPSSPSDTVVAITTPSAFNENVFTHDRTISGADIRFDGGTQSSAGMPLVTTARDMYNSQNRKGAGSVVKTGKPFKGYAVGAWYGGSDVLEETFYTSVGSSSVDLSIAEITSSVGGTMGFEIEILATGTSPASMSKSIGAFVIKDGGATIHQPSATGLPTAGSLPTISYVNDEIVVTLPNTFTGYYLKATAVGRSSENYVRFNWL